MRLLELTRLDGAWRMWAVSYRPQIPPATPFTQYLVWPDPQPIPATFAKYENGTFVVDGYTPPAAPAAVGVARMSKLAFRSRFTEAEQIALEVAMDTHPNAQVKAALRVFDKNLSNAADVDLTDPRTQLAIGRLVSFSLISTQRAAEILDPNWTPVT